MPFVVLAADAENQVTFGTEGAAEKEGLATAVGIAAEAAAAVRVVHAFALEGAVARRFADALRGPRRVALRRALALGLGFGSSQALQSLATAVIFKVGLALMTAGRTTPESVILCFFSFQFASFGLPNLVSLSGDVAAIRASVKSIFSLVRREPEIDGSAAAEAVWAAGGGAAAALPAAGRLELRDVHFAYPSRPAAVLRGVSLAIEPGQTAALVGPSGCGKSSVVALFLRLYDAQAGAVLVDGLDVRARPARALRDRMGWVGQEAPLFADTIAYNVAYGRAGGAANKPAPSKELPPPPPPPAATSGAGAEGGEGSARQTGSDSAEEGGSATVVVLAPEPIAASKASGKGGKGSVAGVEAEAAAKSPAAAPLSPPPPPPEDVARAAADAQAAGFISGFAAGFATHVGDGGRALSGGQRQRVVLARALVRAPAFLLLDEATAALDNASERAVQESIDALLAARRGAMTTLVVAHRLSTIRRADVIFVMDAGRVVERGTFDELVAGGGLFARLASAQGVAARAVA
jgi:ATP-binding cassette subfamily B (MDR/TAP) protein 1